MGTEVSGYFLRGPRTGADGRVGGRSLRLALTTAAGGSEAAKNLLVEHLAREAQGLPRHTGRGGA